MLTLDDRACAQTEVVVTELDGEAVLLHLGTRQYYTLNATGVQIWKWLTADRTLREIGERLQQAFDVTPAQAQASVLRLAGELQAERLIDVIRD